jgi:hypothetical protein
MKTLYQDYRNRSQKSPVLVGLFVSHSDRELCGIKIEKIDRRLGDTP